MIEKRGYNMFLESEYTTNQEIDFSVDDLIKNELLEICVRHDDRCGNGHNTFSITADLYTQGYIKGEPSTYQSNGVRVSTSRSGMLHDEIRKRFPMLSPYLKWHLCSTDGPLHYIENTTYWAWKGDLEKARSCAIWPVASIEQLRDIKVLKNRLPGLMKEFKSAVEELGLVY
jgi:hypothetical protein